MKSSEPSSPDRAYRTALSMLASRDYSTQRIRERLIARRGIEASDADAAISRLMEEGWLDDRRFARRCAESLIARRFSGVRLRMEMRRRAVSVSLIDEILTPLLNERDESDDIRSVIEHRFPDFIFSEADDKLKRRVISFLQRRGFQFSLIMDVLRVFGKNESWQ